MKRLLIKDVRCKTLKKEFINSTSKCKTFLQQKNNINKIKQLTHLERYFHGIKTWTMKRSINKQKIKRNNKRN